MANHFQLFSGGERQRVKLAQNIKKKGNIYILDEPTTGLHASDIIKVMEILEGIVDRGNTVIVIEHNTDVCIIAQPLLENIDIEKYIDNIELVVVGGESDINARPLDYSWVLDIREQCIRKNVSFEFRQCGTYFIKDGKQYKLLTKDLCKQAKLANIDYKKKQ